jgi:hypothetical protein
MIMSLAMALSGVARKVAAMGSESFRMGDRNFIGTASWTAGTAFAENACRLALRRLTRWFGELE